MFQGQFFKIIHKLKVYTLAMDHNEIIQSSDGFKFNILNSSKIVKCYLDMHEDTFTSVFIYIL